jgi:hypothetical protein
MPAVLLCGTSVQRIINKRVVLRYHLSRSLLFHNTINNALMKKLLVSLLIVLFCVSCLLFSGTIGLCHQFYPLYPTLSLLLITAGIVLQWGVAFCNSIISDARSVQACSVVRFVIIWIIIWLLQLIISCIVVRRAIKTVSKNNPLTPM